MPTRFTDTRYKSFLNLLLFICLFISLMTLGMPAVDAEEIATIKVIGTVPKFHEQHLHKKWAERWYYNVQFPEFRVKPIDTILVNFVNGLLVNVPEYAQSTEHPDATPVEEIWSEIGITSTVSASSPRYMSVVFTVWDHGGGIHAHYYSMAFTFDLVTNRQMVLGDTFINWKASDKKLIQLINQLLIEGDYNVSGMKGFFDPAIQTPDSTAFQLIPEGMSIFFNYDPPWLWGDNALLIPKEKLITIGAKPQLWAKQ